MIALVGNIICVIFAIFLGCMLFGLACEILGVIWAFVWGIIEGIFEFLVGCLLFAAGGLISGFSKIKASIKKRRKYGRQL